MNITYILSVVLMVLISFSGVIAGVRIVPLAKGWAKNAVNAVIFRRNSVVTDKETQYVAFYDADGFVVLAKRKLGSVKWETRKTQYTGNIKDAHNSISIMVDGDGYLHMSWDHHNNPLRYCRGKAPGSIEVHEQFGRPDPDGVGGPGCGRGSPISQPRG